MGIDKSHTLYHWKFNGPQLDCKTTFLKLISVQDIHLATQNLMKSHVIRA